MRTVALPPRRLRQRSPHTVLPAKGLLAVSMAAGLLGLVLTSPVHADDVDPPGVDAAAAPGAGPKPLWEAGIGAIAGAVADYPGSNQYRVRGLPLPYFIYRGEFVRSDASGPRLQKSTGNIEWEFSGGGSLSSNSAGGARSGMPRLDYLLEFGPKAKITVAKPTATSRLLIDVPLRMAVSTNFSSRFGARGVIFAPDVAYEEQAILGSHWSGRASLGVQFATASLQRFYYEVQPEYARPGRPAYDASSGYLGATLAITAFRQLTHNFNVFFALDMDSFQGAANVDSPLLRVRSNVGAAVGFAWSLGQSTRLAPDAH